MANVYYLDIAAYTQQFTQANLGDSGPVRALWPDGYVHVASVNTDDVERIFEQLNTETVVYRSMSVGDVIVTSTGTWLCMPTGWEKIAPGMFTERELSHLLFYKRLVYEGKLADDARAA